MKKERKAHQFIAKAIYPGGYRSMGKFIDNNIKYPKDALLDKIEGVVRIKIEIDYKGKVIGSQVLSSLSPTCDKEAKRLVKLLTFEIDQKVRKGKIRFHKTLNIKFKLPKQNPKAINQASQIKYQITPSPKPKPENQPKKATYSYTIKY